MPATPEHKGEMHVLATERRRAGLPVWRYKIDVGGPWNDDELSPQEQRDQIVAIIKASPWYVERMAQAGDDADFDDLFLVVEEMEEINERTEDEFYSYFNLCWDALYDLADYDRVWIDRF